MSTTLSLIAQDISLYFGIPMFIFGVIGNIDALMVMLSLQTFRKNSCAFYLIIMQIYNLDELFTGLLSRIVITCFKNDATQTVSFYCKFRSFIITRHAPNSKMVLKFWFWILVLRRFWVLILIRFRQSWYWFWKSFGFEET